MCWQDIIIWRSVQQIPFALASGDQHVFEKNPHRYGFILASAGAGTLSLFNTLDTGVNFRVSTVGANESYQYITLRESGLLITQQFRADANGGNQLIIELELPAEKPDQLCPNRG